MQVTSDSKSGGMPYKWIVAIVVVFGSFMSILDQTVVNNAFPSLQHAFTANLNDLQWVITGYTLTQGVVTPATAFFANRLGTKRFYVIALILFTLGSALCGLSWNLPSLIVFRIVQASGGAALFPLAITLLFSEFPVHQRGLASGILSISALMAPAIGPTLGGYIVTYASWPLIFYINVPVGIVGIILALWLLRPHASEGRVHFDLPGFVLVAVGLASFLYALSNVTVSGWGSTLVLVTLIVGLCSLVLFIVFELIIARRGGQPLVDLRLFGNGPFLFSNIANAMVGFSFFGALILFPIYLQDLRGVSAFQSGLLTLPLAFAAVLAAVVGGWLVDRVGPRSMLFAGLLLMGFSTWQLTGETLTTSYPWLVLIYALRGLGLGCLVQTLTVASFTKVEASQYTQASSLNTVVRFVFTSLGIAVLATFVQSRVSTHVESLLSQSRPHTRAAFALLSQQGLNSAVQDAFWLSLVGFVVAFIAICFLRTRKPTSPEKAGRRRTLSSSMRERGLGELKQSPTMGTQMK